MRQLAARAATSHSTLAAYESGAKSPNTDTFLRILRAAGFEPSVVLVPRGPFFDEAARAAEIEQVLALADALPVRHERVMPHPVFARP